MNVHDWVRQASVRLTAAGVQASRLEAQVLAGRALNADRTAVLTHPSAEVPERADAMLERRLAGEPLAYILGYREFYSRRFTANPSVLIPRQETETLVEVLLRLTPEGGKVIDVGTGSGCIAITAKLERPDLQVTGVDISDEALETARKNAAQLGAAVEFYISDLFESVEGMFDVIVSNPPYVADGAMLAPEVRDHEPARALFAGPHGLAIYERIAASARPKLAPEGALILEMGDGMESQIRTCFDRRGWRMIEMRNDLGRMPRALVLG